MSTLKSLYLAIFFIFISCSPKKSEIKSYVEIIIDNSKIKDSQDISNQIDSISILPLIEQNGNHFSSVFKLYIKNNNYIIFDRVNTNKILLFDCKGTFIKTIVKMGDGINDPLNISDCWFNEKNELEVYDFGQMKIFQFDSSFKLKNILKSSLFNHFVSMNTIPGTNNYVGYANYGDYNKIFNKKLYQVAFLDSNLNVIDADKNFDKKFQDITWPIYKQHFYKYNDTLRFVKSYDNFIYNIGNKVIKERFKISYTKNNLPDDVMPIVEKNINVFRNRYLNPNIKAAYFKNYCRFTGLWLENSKYFYISSKDNVGEFGTSFYSIIDKKVNIEMVSTRSFNAMDKYKLVLPPFEFYDEINDEFISLLNGLNLKELLLKESPFYKNVENNPNVFYLLKVKLK